MNHIQKLIEKSKKGKLYKNNSRYIFVSKYNEWIKGVEAHVKHIGDGEKFFIDTDDKGVMRAFFKDKKVGVWGGVPENGYYNPAIKMPAMGNPNYNNRY